MIKFATICNKQKIQESCQKIEILEIKHETLVEFQNGVYIHIQNKELNIKRFVASLGILMSNKPPFSESCDKGR